MSWRLIQRIVIKVDRSKARATAYRLRALTLSKTDYSGVSLANLKTLDRNTIRSNFTTHVSRLLKTNQIHQKEKQQPLGAEMSHTNTVEFRYASGKIPSKRYETSALYDGEESVYIFGGTGDRCDQLKDIVNYNLSIGEVRRIGRFPNRIEGGIVIDGGNGKYFHVGGYSNGKPRNTIYEFTKEDISPIEVHTLSVNVSSTVAGSAENFYWHDRYYGCIHGYNFETGYEGVLTNQVCKYEGVALAFVNGILYGFGGSDEGGNSSSGEIFKFDVELNEVKVLDKEIDAGCMTSVTVVVGTDIYIIGGRNDDEKFRFTKFNTLTEEIEDFAVNHNMRFGIGMLERPNAVYVPDMNRMYIFCGRISNVANENIYYVQLQ